MIAVVAGIISIATGFFLGRFTFNFLSDIGLSWDDEGTGEFKTAGALLGAASALVWCEIALLCGAVWWAVAGIFLGGVVVPVVVVVVCGVVLVAAIVVVVAIAAAFAGLGWVVRRGSQCVDSGYSKFKKAIGM